MIILDLIVGGLLLLSFVWFLHRWRRLRRQELINATIAEELSHLLERTKEEIKKNKNLITKAKQIIDDPHNATAENESYDPMGISSPAMLSSLITVLVHKHGMVRLSLDDFTAVDDGYVSVYVDTSSQEIILSLKNDLGGAPSSELFGFGGPDDETYH